MMHLPNDLRAWYIVFMPKTARRLRWYHCFLRKDFGHVFAFTEVAGGTLKVDHTIWGTSVVWAGSITPEQCFNMAEGHASAILRVDVDYNRVPMDYIQRGLISCVSVLNSMLALRRCWSFTPWGLYKYLMTCKDPSEAHLRVEALKPYSPYCMNVKSVSE